MLPKFERVIQESQEDHEMVETGASLRWRNRRGGYVDAVVMNVVFGMAEMAPVFSLQQGVTCYDDEWAGPESADNVRLRGCPKPFSDLCESVVSHECFADASADARMMYSVERLRSMGAMRPGWDPVSAGVIGELYDHRRREQMEQQKTYTPEDIKNIMSSLSVGPFLQSMNEQIKEKSVQQDQLDEEQESTDLSLLGAIAERDDAQPEALSAFSPVSHMHDEASQRMFSNEEINDQARKDADGLSFC